VHPFRRQGIDLIGRLPKTKDGNRWILTAIDYATGWPIAKALLEATEEAIVEFIFKEIYLQFGAPQETFTDGQWLSIFHCHSKSNLAQIPMDTTKCKNIKIC
jgi:hypothetical protein